MILSLRMTTVLGGRAVFTETLGYDSPAVSLGGPSYTGLITRKVETWSVPIGPSDSLSVSRTEDYAYDYAARLSAWDNTTDGEDISYDERGNITSRAPRHGQGATVTLTYTGDRLATRKEGTGAAVPFAHDAFARMTTDAESGLSIAYNALDLPESISQGTTLKARYTYLSDGTKVSALDATGAGLVYRGPFTYRRNPSGTLTFESASFDGGRLTEEGPDFGLPYIDYGARQYSPALSRWLVPDPMGEKYYDVSPYAYCAGNPVCMVDFSGESYSDFDIEGNYLQTINDNWWHNLWHGRRGRIVDDEGNVIQSFKFADPKHDVADLKEGNINRVQFVQESEIISMLSKAGAFDQENKVSNLSSGSRYDYIKTEGMGGGKFDFSYNKVIGIPAHYPDVSTKPLKQSSKMLFLIDGVAHNHMNYGNFLYGAAGKALGLSVLELQMGAQWNSLSHPSSNDYPSQFDSRDDQKSIRLGVRHANQHGYKDMYYKIIVGPLILNGFTH